jgi:hypothetical protein
MNDFLKSTQRVLAPQALQPSIEGVRHGYASAAQHRLHKIARVGSLGSSSTTNSVRQRQHHVDHAPPVE